jgi:hypothetical protein
VWSTYDFGTLFLPTAAIFIVTAAVSLRVTGSFAVSLSASLIKAGLFLWYFSTLFDGTYGLLDDQTYIAKGEQFFAKGIGLHNLGDHWPLILSTAGGPHFAYYLYNVYAIHLFGHGYFAPVALNAVVSVFIAYIGASIAARELGFSGPLHALFYAFLLINPDVLVWSSFINDKDILVLFMHVMLLYGFSLWFQSRTVLGLSLLASASFLLLFLRFYVPLFFALALLASTLVGRRTRGRIYWFVAGALLVASAVMVIGLPAIAQGFDAVRGEFVNPALGALRFLLTPIPLNTERGYAFLDLPATVHWILFPFAVFGAYKIYQIGTPFSRFFLIYFATFAALYSIFGELQGPRHRVQLDFAWAVFQFAGLLALVKDAHRSAPAAREIGVPSE